MFCLLSEARRLFSTQNSYREVATEVSAVYSCTVSTLPNVSDLDNFLNSFRACDSVELSIKNYLDFAYHPSSLELWKTSYCQFIDSCNPDDPAEVTIHINKRPDDRGAFSIYCFDIFLNYYCNISWSELLRLLSSALASKSQLKFYVLDKEINISTNSICFYNDTSMKLSLSSNRSKTLSHCNSSALFLSQNEYALSPFDFHVIQNTSTGEDKLLKLIYTLETAFSLVYLAYSSYITNNQIILQISVSSPNLVIPLADLPPCHSICDLFFWTFDNDFAVERSGIVRNLLDQNCKTPDDLYLKDDTILLSAKSNYILFQKKTIDTYIELKNKISLVIVEAANQMHTILQTLLDGLKNNFVAVIMFLITVLLTDSISWDDLKTGMILNQDLILILQIFCFSSFVYLIVTIVSVFIKWKLFSHSYEDLKKNYEDLLDKADLSKAFDNDNAIRLIRNNVFFASAVTTIIWSGFLCFLCQIIGQA